MKKTITFCSIIAVLLLSLSTNVIAATPTVEMGRTGIAYMTDAYVGVPNIAEFWITGKNIQGDITFTGSSVDDPTATYKFQPNTITKAQSSGYNSMVVHITPHKVASNNTYYIQPVSEGLICEPIAISFAVLDTIPAITEVTTEPLWGDFYVGETYKREMYVVGNDYISDRVYFEIPEGSDVIALSAESVHQDSVKTSLGYKLDVTFRPSEPSLNDSTKSTFPIVIKTKGMEDYTTHAMQCQVKATNPELEITTGGYGKDVYVNTPFTKTIWIKGNAYLKGDITLTKKNESDNITFSPAVITKEAAMQKDGAEVEVTITPSEVTADKTYFYFTVSTEGYSEECNIWVWEVKDKTPRVTLSVENSGYIMEDAYKGEPFEVTITAKANQFTTDSIYFFSDDAQITGFEPAAVSADDAKSSKGVDVIVTIVAAKGSPTVYTKQSFVVKAKTQGAEADAEATIELVVLPVEEWETALENVKADQKTMKVLDNGQVYIVKDGVKYSVLGIEIQ